MRTQQFKLALVVVKLVLAASPINASSRSIRRKGRHGVKHEPPRDQRLPPAMVQIRRRIGFQQRF
jgi:hypothetical protein